MKSNILHYIACCIFLVTALSVESCASSENTIDPGKVDEKPVKSTVEKYRNPVLPISLPDPTVIKADDGYFYLYATEDIRNTPIYKSKDLVNWTFVSTAFTDETRPRWNDKGGIWAPDINYINGKYVLYYAKSEWGGEWTCGIGVATADKPDGPFTDHGAIINSQEIDVRNSIDGFYIEENGHKYMFWGSFAGIYGIELSDDGLSIKSGTEKVQIAGNQMEGTYIHKHGDYYYLFGSNGTCCDGAQSTYQVIYGRSKNLFGPYVAKNGQSMLSGGYDVLLHGTHYFAGPGHNAEFVTDDKGQDWIIYHCYLKADPGKGRLVMLDQVLWQDDWPLVAGHIPSYEHEIPYFNK
ncbi:MAG: family 43 glycosylhydrolase [Phocaeicola sp.]|uniref:family 43 glycosylhydrolase n=1 Tax=Phocaeicola TaxID=909656 RepID=UPI00234EEB7C|nr:family 43 glycosylhydrolase [Phocaeicola oris]MCE2617603.1 family 43 glycosylhydrolase [Phocaeicola oris]